MYPNNNTAFCIHYAKFSLYCVGKFCYSSVINPIRKFRLPAKTGNSKLSIWQSLFIRENNRQIFLFCIPSSKCINPIFFAARIIYGLFVHGLSPRQINVMRYCSLPSSWSCVLEKRAISLTSGCEYAMLTKLSKIVYILFRSDHSMKDKSFGLSTTEVLKSRFPLHLPAQTIAKIPVL